MPLGVTPLPLAGSFEPNVRPSVDRVVVSPGVPVGVGPALVGAGTSVSVRVPLGCTLGTCRSFRGGPLATTTFGIGGGAITVRTGGEVTGCTGTGLRSETV